MCLLYNKYGFFDVPEYLKIATILFNCLTMHSVIFTSIKYMNVLSYEFLTLKFFIDINRNHLYKEIVFHQLDTMYIQHYSIFR